MLRTSIGVVSRRAVSASALLCMALAPEGPLLAQTLSSGKPRPQVTDNGAWLADQTDQSAGGPNRRNQERFQLQAQAPRQPPGAQRRPTAPPQPGTIIPPPAVVDDARARQFGRSAVVPTEPPTLSIDIGKGTIVKLRAAASTVFVANPDIADVQVKTGGTIYIFGKKAGETVLYAVDEQDRVLLNTVVLVGYPTGRVISNVAGLPGGAQIQATTVGGSVVLGGRSDNPAAIEHARRMSVGVTGDPAKVINNVALDGSTQVLLRVRIIESQRETLKRLGFNWETLFKLSGKFTLGLSTPTDITASNGSVARIADPTGGAISGVYSKGAVDIAGLIDLLATESMLTVLAEPNLIAKSGETAKFLAGGEFPIVVPQGNSSYAVQFKQYGVSLSFTPTIQSAGRITLKIIPEVSQLSTNGQVSYNGFTIPALTTRRVDTTVELGSGQSFAVAGLIQNNGTQDISKLPGLGDIPILGMLFKSDSFKRSESELVVIVTPYLVEPVGKTLATPIDGHVPPTDADRYLWGRTYRPQSPGRGQRPVDPRTVGGFVLE